MWSESLRKNKWIYAVESFLMSLSGVCSLHIHFEGLNKDNYVNDFGFEDIIFFLLLFVISFLLLPVLYYVIDEVFSRIRGKNTDSDQTVLNSGSGAYLKEIIPWGIIGVLVYVPYFLTFYPGGIWADTFASIYAGKETVLTNRHPFLYNIGIGTIVKICEILRFDMNRTCAALTAIQMIMMLAVFLYFFYWMIANRIPVFLRIIISAIFILSPVFALYGISVWKDTPYSLGMMLWMIWSYDLYRELSDEKDRSVGTGVYVRFLIGAFLAAFLRNNGKYVVTLSLIVWIVILIIGKVKKKFWIGMIVFAAAVFIIQGPLYDIIGVKDTDTVEKYAIPLQQVSAAVARGGSVSDEQMEILSHFVSPEDIRALYDPINADTVKWADSFNDDYLREHQGEFLRLWAGVLIKNPSIYLQAYLINTCCFWDITSNPNSVYAYVQTSVWENFYNVSSTDKWEQIFRFSIMNKLVPHSFINGALLVWIYILAAFYFGMRYGRKAVVVLIPNLAMWGTVMIATPIAVSFRYISPMLFCLPVMVVIMVMITCERNLER